MANRTQLTEPRLIVESRAQLGESPVWDERAQRLYWVDIGRGRLHWCGACGERPASAEIGGPIGCIALRRDRPGLVAGLQHSIVTIDHDPLRVTTVAEFADLPVQVRCNDGKCDPAGRFWIGTYDMDNAAATAWLYRYAPGGAPEPAAGPFICANGPAFSPDGTFLYCVDTYGRRIDRWRLRADGGLCGRSCLARFDTPGCGYPDGLTCDSQGCLWVAEWGAARVVRLSPDGEPLEVIRLPTSQPSSCAFGGPELRRLFITSAAQGLPGSGAAESFAGGLFAVDLTVPGLPAGRFAG